MRVVSQFPHSSNVFLFFSHFLPEPTLIPKTYLFSSTALITVPYLELKTRPPELPKVCFTKQNEPRSRSQE